MSAKLSKTISILLTFILLLAVTTSALAAPPRQGATCDMDYIVQANDWLSKLAEKNLGDVLAYPLIVEATNAAAAVDSSYATIDNPDLIEIGWKLCIPSPEESQMMAAEGEGQMMAEEGESQMMAEEGEGQTMAEEGEAQMMAEGEGAETTFTVRIENISDGFDYQASGIFNTPVGADGPGPLLPGNVYEAAFNAEPGDKLSFASMFVQSNDWFIAPGQAGITLFNDDISQVTGDITDQIQLWDAGTEVDQEPGLGADQAPRQAGPNTGDADPDNTVHLVGDAFENVPAVSDLVKVTLESTSDNGFVLRIENVSTELTLVTSEGNSTAVPFAPGVWVLHSGDNPLFSEGQADAGLGLEALAEDGNPAELAAALGAVSGRATPLAPGVWAVHSSPDPFFTAGQADRGQGLEALAEDGNPADLAAAVAEAEGILSSGVFNTPAGAAGPGPLLPGNAYEFTFEAGSGALSFATMYVQSNDLFFAPLGAGIPLFGADGSPVSGDVTDRIQLWDAGTEVNQAPNFGPDQAPRQAGPDTGADENGVVQPVSDGFTYPSTAKLIRVTITAQ